MGDNLESIVMVLLLASLPAAFWAAGRRRRGTAAAAPRVADQPPPPPDPSAWRTRPSIHDWLQQIVARDPEAGYSGDLELPDERLEHPDQYAAYDFREIRGELAGTGILSSEDEQEIAKRAVPVIKAALRSPSSARLDTLYAILNESPVLDYTSALHRRLLEEREIDPVRLHDLAVTLAEFAADREPAKAAILLLGMLRGFDDRLLLQPFAVHPEFSLFVQAALEAQRPDDAPALGAAALPRVLLPPKTVGAIASFDPQCARWILREGFRLASCCLDRLRMGNDFGRESDLHRYARSLHFCAEAGRLHERLAEEGIDRTLLVGAGDLLEMLISEGDPGLHTHGADAVEAYLAQVRRHPEAPEPYCALRVIRHFLTIEQSRVVAWQAPGWSAARRESLLAEATALLARPGWEERIRAGLSGPHGASRRACERAVSSPELMRLGRSWQPAQGQATAACVVLPDPLEEDGDFTDRELRASAEELFRERADSAHLAGTGAGGSELRSWLLREGWHGSRPAEDFLHGDWRLDQVTLPCVVVGDLLGALEAEDIDEPLLVGAGQLFKGLIAGRDDGFGFHERYNDLRPAILHYLRHVARRPDALEPYVPLRVIESFLCGAGREIGEARRHGWTPAEAAGLRHAARAMINGRDWPALAAAARRSDDPARVAVAELTEWYLTLPRPA